VIAQVTTAMTTATTEDQHTIRNDSMDTPSSAQNR
jgi:hypothetical protein